MRIRRQLALVMAMALLAVAVSAVAAGAGVERYQQTKDTYLLLANNVNYHEYQVDVMNPCDGSYDATGMWMGTDENNLDDRGLTWHQELSNWDETGNTISFHSNYPNYAPGYSFDFTGTFNGVSWVGTGTDSGGSWPATLTLTTDWTSDYNHGDYVAASIELYGSPDAHSCIGMPKNSKKNK